MSKPAGFPRKCIWISYVIPFTLLLLSRLLNSLSGSCIVGERWKPKVEGHGQYSDLHFGGLDVQLHCLSPWRSRASCAVFHVMIKLSGRFLRSWSPNAVASHNRGNQRKLASLQEFKKRGMEVRWATVVGRNVGINVWTSMVCPKLVSRALSLRAEVFRERIFLLATKPGFHFKADFFWRNFALFL